MRIHISKRDMKKRQDTTRVSGLLIPVRDNNLRVNLVGLWPIIQNDCNFKTWQGICRRCAVKTKLKPRRALKIPLK
jgi:hypothetical protein